MTAIAILAVLFGAFGVAGAWPMAVVLGAIVLPVVLAGPGRRLRAAAWVGALYPLSLPASLYATWFTAWLVLGHRPRRGLDDPYGLGPVVQFPAALTFWFGFSLPLSLFISIAPMMAYIAVGTEQKTLSRWRASALVLVPVAVWLSVCAGLLGSGEVVAWYLDR